MRILAHVHMAAPEHGAGAEWMLHAILKDLVGRGHECTIMARDAAPGTRMFEGVEIIGSPGPGELGCGWNWCDVAITHLDMTLDAMRACAKHKKPLVHLVHNHLQLAANGVSRGTAQLVVFNSEWLAKENAWWQGDTMVAIPPVRVRDYQGCEGGDSVTLINLQAAKGALSFYAAARALSVPFLGVRGAWGDQIDGVGVTIIENQPDVRRVYQATRVLLMPSFYESWGRCAIEAACSGIPTIYHPTPGLAEALGPAGLPCNRDDGQTLCDLITRLYDDEAFYREHAALARARAIELEEQSNRELDDLEDRMLSLVGVTPGGFTPVHPSQQGWKP